MAELATAQARAAINRVIRAIEPRSAVELAVAVRREAGPHYLAAELLVGIVAATGTLAGLLYAPIGFGRLALLIDPIAVGIIAAVVSSRLAPLRRRLTPIDLRERFVVEAARATFFAQGINRTRAATGVLIYIAVLERRIEVVADHGVTRAATPESWAEAIATLQRSLAGGGGGDEVERVAEAIAAFGERLAAWLPRDPEGRC